MKSAAWAAAIGGLAATMAAAVLLALAGKSLSDAVSAVFTALGGAAAAFAAYAALRSARASEQTAAKTVQALALHFRPQMSAWGDLREDDAGPYPVFRVALSGAASVSDVLVSWTGADGVRREHRLQPNALGGLDDVRLAGVALVPIEGGHKLAEPVVVRVECRDTVISNRWGADVTLTEVPRIQWGTPMRYDIPVMHDLSAGS